MTTWGHFLLRILYTYRYAKDKSSSQQKNNTISNMVLVIFLVTINRDTLYVDANSTWYEIFMHLQ